MQLGLLVTLCGVLEIRNIHFNVHFNEVYVLFPPTEKLLSNFYQFLCFPLLSTIQVRFIYIPEVF